MQIIRDVFKAEVVALFLKTELTSRRFGEPIKNELTKVGRSKSIITAPNILDDDDNAYRLDLLGKVRGFDRNERLFENFPDDVKWVCASLRRSELERVKYIDYDYWVEMSNGTRLVKDGADSIRNGKIVFNMPNDGFWSAAEALKNGARFEQMIFVAKDEQSSLVVLEGHLRLTAYFLADKVPDRMQVIIGFSPNMQRWGLY